MQKRLENKVIIVTGAGTALSGVGNGKAAAVQFAREGARVVCVDLKEEAAAAPAESPEPGGHRHGRPGL